jgi:hypothetical protein
VTSMGGMNLGLQEHTVKKKLRNRGINPDTIDLKAELDSTLSLRENLDNLEEKYGKLERTGRNFRARREEGQARRRELAQREAKSTHEERPPLNQYIDETKDAEKTFRDPTERQMNKWRNNPNQYDIEGVDTRKNPEAREQVTLPFQRQRDVLYEGSKEDLRKSMRQIPGSIKKNATGRKERMARKVRDQGFDQMMAEKERMAVPQNALIDNFDVPDVVEEDRERVSRIENRVRALREDPSYRHAENVTKGLSMTEKVGKDLEADSGTRASEILKDSREIGTVEKNLNGTTSEKSEQKGLRDQGIASKDSEKTLDKWDGNYI